MRYLLATVFLTADVLAGGTPLPHRVPDVIESQVAGRPAWVAADVAFGEDGRLRSDLFAEHWRRAIDRYLADKEKRRNAATTEADRDECATRIGHMIEQAAPTATIDHLIQYSRAIVTGTVVEAREGFLFGSPGTLAAIDVETWLKNVDGAAQTVFLFHPSARIRTPHGTICGAPVRPAPTPSAGDRLMLFAYLKPIGEGVSIFAVEPSSQMVLRGSQVEQLPDAIRRSIGEEWTEIVSFVRRHPAIKIVPKPEMQ